MTDDGLLRARILDKIRESAENYCAACTSFLDAASCAVAVSVCKKERARYELFGGYDDAERKICFILPDYAESLRDCFSEEDFPLVIVRAANRNPARALSHRDYLGSLMALGIKRETIGDIIICQSGADIITVPQTAVFLADSFDKAGNCPIETQILPIGALRAPAVRTEEKRDTVASPRLDNIVSAAFDLSRSAASEAIAAGFVFVNDEVAEKADRQVAAGSKIVLRGKGKVVLREFRGESRKGRTVVIFDKYI